MFRAKSGRTERTEQGDIDRKRTDPPLPGTPKSPGKEALKPGIMHVTIVSTHAKLPVTAYGGTERVVWYLAYELHKMGHQVTFLAAKGSTCPFAEVQPINPERPLSEQIPEKTDVVHFNGETDQATRKPYLTTLHGNGISSPLHRNTVFVSRNHAQRHGSRCFVYNGMNWEDYGIPDLEKPRHYYHFLGKAAWRVKNVRGAIRVIRRLPGEKLAVIGGHRLNLKMGFRFTLTPQARFHGMVGGEEKLRLLQGSKGLIFPVLWNEPFGLAITESLYMGAPVFGTPYGSLPELVTPETGYLTRSAADMAHHLNESQGAYSPRICHEYARDLFNSRRMAERYVTLYEKVLNGEYLNPVPPQQIPHTAPINWKN